MNNSFATVFRTAYASPIAREEIGRILRRSSGEPREHLVKDPMSGSTDEKRKARPWLSNLPRFVPCSERPASAVGH